MKSKAQYMAEKWLVKQPAYSKEAQNFYRQVLTYEFQLQTVLNQKVKKILADSNTPSIYNIPYHNYARHVFKILKTTPKPQQTSRLKAATARWQKLGLEPKILKRLLASVRSLVKNC
ncbi:MAG: hypothetical protein NZ601_07270 [candidate division WOR-3 bacterium]|nr:hypothetical protein [candidate division WOR-3 bacterium]MCX7757899.1 hypothetical protein [candidate division WOR-3 bacterium]MDW7987354.1 hypothetical protein [candidate division WOR-3 bacterium]